MLKLICKNVKLMSTTKQKTAAVQLLRDVEVHEL